MSLYPTSTSVPVLDFQQSIRGQAELHELTLLKAQILGGIDRVLGAPRLVDDLKLHIGVRKQVDADDMIALAQQARRRRGRVAAADDVVPALDRAPDRGRR